MTVASLHAGQPFQAVIHIEHTKGPKGAPIWRLKLECGHSTSRRIPNPPVEHAIFLPVRTAPRRVKCLFCPPENNQ